MKIRLRDIPLKCNSPNLYSDKNCLAAPQCKGEDSNIHIFSCSYYDSANQVTTMNMRYADIFSNNVKRQETVASILFKRLEERSKFLPQSEEGSHDPIQFGIRETGKKIRKKTK